jgi:hypothetical protein
MGTFKRATVSLTQSGHQVFRFDECESAVGHRPSVEIGNQQNETIRELLT